MSLPAKPVRKTSWIAGLIILIGAIPIAWYWMAAARLPIDASQQLYHAMTVFEQITAVVGGFVLKPTHMLLSVLIIWALLRIKAQDLVALRWGVFFFLLGESFCAINYLIFKHGSDLAEFLHSYGMVVGFAFTFYALIEGLDARLLKLSHPGKKCAATDLCGQCSKAQRVPCGARRIILLALPMLAILAAMPLAAELSTVSYGSVILGTPYTYSWPVLYQLFEARYIPIVAMVLFACALGVMLIASDQPIPDSARLLAASGFGALSFGMARVVLKTMFAQNLVWADFWEEATELMIVLAIAVVLVIFRRQLFREAFPGEREIKLWDLFWQ